MKLIFAGTPQNAAQSLEAISRSHEVLLVLTRPDAEIGRKRILTPSPVAQTAIKLGIPVLKIGKFTPEVVQEIKEAGAELAIVVAFGAIISDTALKVLPWWNMHFSLLPQWRGATPLQHSILHGGLGSGVTIFEIEKGLDTGPILSAQQVDLLPDETTLDALPRFTEIATDLFLRTASAAPTATAQHGEATMAPKFGRTEAKIDWLRTSTEIARQISAMNPEPMAWCLHDNQPFRILRARAIELEDKTSIALGEVRGGAQITVCCGEQTFLELIEVQPAGKKPMSSFDWFRGQTKDVTLG